MLTCAKNEAVKFRDEREIYRCTRKRQGCTRKRHASGRGSPPSQPSQLLRLQSLRSADIHNTPSNLCGGQSTWKIMGSTTVGRTVELSEFFSEFISTSQRLFVDVYTCEIIIGSHQIVTLGMLNHPPSRKCPFLFFRLRECKIT